MRGKFYIPFVVVMIASMIFAFGCAPKAKVKVEPIKIGVIADLARPQGQNAVDAMTLAADEINESGGILGRPVKIVVADSKGETSLAVQGAIRLVTDEHVIVYTVVSQSEIALACKEKSADLFTDYPHILFVMQCKANAVMANIIEQYDRYKFFFGDWVSEESNLGYFTAAFQIAKEVVGAEKIAILYDDLLWSKKFREGFPEIGLPSCDVMAEEDWGLDVVYSKALKLKTGMYLPILEAIAQAGAEFIYVPCCGFRDTEVLVKQWSESSAKDIPLKLLVGPSELGDVFVELTGGKCLGVMSTSHGMEVPVTEKTIPFLRKCKERGIYVDFVTHTAYSDVYFAKAAIEAAGGTDDIDSLIKAWETVETVWTLGAMKMTEEKKFPYYHGGVEMYLDNVKQFDPHWYSFTVIQYQEDGPVVVWPKELATGSYKKPSEL